MTLKRKTRRHEQKLRTNRNRKYNEKQGFLPAKKRSQIEATKQAEIAQYFYCAQAALWEIKDDKGRIATKKRIAEDLEISRQSLDQILKRYPRYHGEFNYNVFHRDLSQQFDKWRAYDN